MALSQHSFFRLQHKLVSHRNPYREPTPLTAPAILQPVVLPVGNITARLAPISSRFPIEKLAIYVKA